jgi:hypothetical protein
MKSLNIILVSAILFMSCKKAETPKPAAPVVVAITPPATSHWQYMYDTCKKITLTADSITHIECGFTITQAITHLGGDTVTFGGSTYIVKIVGDTLYQVPRPYTVWDSKYYRL